MFASFLLSLREGLEVTLIISILIGVLVKIRRTDLNRQVWQGVGAAAFVSIGIAITLNMLKVEFEGRGEELFEGAAMLLAAGVLTWMILWMRSHGSNLKSELETQANLAALGNGIKGLFALSFLAVLREGIELALYLLAVRLVTDPVQMLVGALMGLSTAILFGWFLFASTRTLVSRNFFAITNVLLIIFAAGMVGLGIHEFNEAGIIPAIIEHVWDMNPVLSDQSQVGLLLKALIGYNGNPSLTSVLGYVGYLTIIIIFFRFHKNYTRPLSIKTNAKSQGTLDTMI